MSLSTLPDDARRWWDGLDTTSQGMYVVVALVTSPVWMTVLFFFTPALLVLAAFYGAAVVRQNPPTIVVRPPKRP